MFEIFGEFNSAEEINNTAAGLQKEGDIESIKVLAKENGIEDMMEFFISGDLPELTNSFMAAIGKLNIEKQEKTVIEFGKKIPADPIVDYLQSRCTENEIAMAVRKKGKSLTECLKYIESEAKKIVKQDAPYLADMTVFLMALDYYMV